jgi:hypothetical protein
LYLSFEVQIPVVDSMHSVLIFPRFAGGESVTSVHSLLDGSVWNSYGGPYSTHASPPAPNRWAYQAPCKVELQQAIGLVDLNTYWINREAGSPPGGSTSEWRKSLEATIASRFDYFPRLLVVMGTGFPPADIWQLGLRMLEDLSDFGDSPGLEGSTIQYALLLRAIEM